ncbi:hypothetical protein BDV97DRAFT_290014, partial [Delphinella strobiligena]
KEQERNMAKKQREPSPSSSSASEAEDVQMTTGSASPEGSKKRKRVAQEGDELEIDVNLPEPQSKKALREAKKAAKRAKKNPETSAAAGAGEEGATKTETPSQATGENAGKRSDYGIWIGNLPFTADKDVVRIFLTRQGQIPEAEITRLHMPVPTHAQPGRPKPNNKGFAYVDFSTAESLKKAIDLSESLMTGRKVLIKDAKSYEGRPQNATPGPTANALAGVVEAPVATTDAAKPVARPGHEPSKRIFVGNLGFDVTKEDLEYHFGQAGEIEDIHMATFQDTGKCKGFAWIRFVELEAAQGAVNGFVFKEEPASDDEEEESEAKKQKKQKKRKWFINRLQGRPLRCEFAEDASTRYKKRFGKGGDKNGDSTSITEAPITEATGADAAPPRQKVRPTGDKDARQEQRRRKHMDARKIRPGAALANAPRGASGAIVASQGKKVTFD